MKHPAQKLYTTAEAASLLSMSVSGVRKLCARGAIAPLYKVSRKQLRIPERAISKLLEESAI